MDTKKVRVLLDALETGSLMKTAERLGYTPSGLTHMMDALERELGTKVLERGRFGVRLNPTGQSILPMLRQLAAAEKCIESELQWQEGGRQEWVRVGASVCTIMPLLQSAMETFHAKYPDVLVELVSGPINSLYTLLEQREVDLCITIRSERQGYEFMQLAEDPFFAVLPKEYDTGGRERFSIDGFNNVNFIMPTNGQNADVEAALREYGVRPNKIIAKADEPGIIAMVRAGLGISMMTRFMLVSFIDKVKILPLEPEIKSYPGLIAPSFQKLSPVARKFMAEVMEANSVT